MRRFVISSRGQYHDDADVSGVLVLLRRNTVPHPNLCCSLPPATMPRARRKDADALAFQRIARLLFNAAQSKSRFSNAADDEPYYEDPGIMWPSNPDNELAAPYTTPSGKTVQTDVSLPTHVCAAMMLANTH